jgi:hypothetical protein
VLGIGGYFAYKLSTERQVVNNKTTETSPVVEEATQTETPEQAVEEEPVDKTKTVIGESVEGRDIVAYHYGEGSKEILFVGGVHGGYSWNTVLVARELMDELEDNLEAVPENLKVTVIPLLNPDGLYKTLGKEGDFDKGDVPSGINERIAGRFNGNGVDLNRNFDCEWQEKAIWQSKEVSGGNEVFSEPESQAVRDYIEESDPIAALVWYSAAGGVFSSNCKNGVLSETNVLTNLYAKASGYKPFPTFNFYEITGDMVNWMAKENIPAISVLLTTHEDVEWEKNWLGIKALLAHYASDAD